MASSFWLQLLDAAGVDQAEVDTAREMVGRLGLVPDANPMAVLTAWVVMCVVGIRKDLVRELQELQKADRMIVDYLHNVIETSDQAQTAAEKAKDR
jgi:hypothetical protein